MLIAAKIEDAIKAKCWKNKDLLDVLGKKNASIVTKWLSGTHNFTIDTLVQLEEALEIELINVSETKKNSQTIIYISSEISTPMYFNNEFTASESVIVYTTQFAQKLKY